MSFRVNVILVEECRSLAKFSLRGIPPKVAGAARVRVTFQVDADGLLSVTAREQTTGVEASVTVKPSYGLSEDEISRTLEDSFGHAEEDMKLRELREQKVEAARWKAFIPHCRPTPTFSMRLSALRSTP